jgi:D-aminoacyl-tRNA deacylase
VLQRVSRALVRCDGGHAAAIGRGLVVLLGIVREDGPADVAALAKKIPRLRLFPDAAGVMNLSLLEMNSVGAGAHATGPPGAPGEILLVSQFTLHADTRRGLRPYYGAAAPPEQAVPLYEAVAAGLRAQGLTVATGVFGAQMEIELAADGPVTILLDTANP